MIKILFNNIVMKFMQSYFKNLSQHIQYSINIKISYFFKIIKNYAKYILNKKFN